MAAARFARFRVFCFQPVALLGEFYIIKKRLPYFAPPPLF